MSFTWVKHPADTLRHMERLSDIARWLRVQHGGAPRWFLAFVVLFAGTVGTVLATHWGN
jgi:hypothetical protein